MISNLDIPTRIICCSELIHTKQSHRECQLVMYSKLLIGSPSVSTDTLWAPGNELEYTPRTQKRVSNVGHSRDDFPHGCARRTVRAGACVADVLGEGLASLPQQSTVRAHPMEQSSLQQLPPCRCSHSRYKCTIGPCRRLTSKACAVCKIVTWKQRSCNLMLLSDTVQSSAYERGRTSKACAVCATDLYWLRWCNSALRIVPVFADIDLLIVPNDTL